VTVIRAIAGWVAVAALLVLAAALFVHGMRSVADFNTPQTSGRATVGEPLPDAPLATLDGGHTSLAAYAGRPLWINFFETWCVPCKAEVPAIEARFAEHRSGGLMVLGVDEQETPAQVGLFEHRFGVTYPLAIDGGAAATAYQVQVIPVSVFVDPHGVIARIWIGEMQPAVMDEALAQILPAR